MLSRQFAYKLKFLLGETYPRRVVGIGINHCRNVPSGKFLFKFQAQCSGSAMMVDVKFLPAYSEDLEL